MLTTVAPTIKAGSIIRDPYPGPKPYDMAAAGVFCGRDSDITRLRKFFSAHRLMLLLARSGVGKTSLLQAGILPDLLQARRQARSGAALPVMIREWWEGTPSPVDVPTAFRNAARKALNDVLDSDDMLDEADARTIRDRLNEEVGGPLLEYSGDAVDLLLAASDAAGSLVVIVDQFEELLRVPLKPGEPGAVEIISRLFQESAGGPAPLRIMLSLRREFESELRALESVPSVGGLGQRSFFLGPIKPTGLHEAITAPAKRIGLEYDDELVQRLVAWMEMPGPWLGAEANDEIIRSDWGEPLGGARLLGLQALLRRIAQTCEPGPVPISVGSSDVDRILGFENEPSPATVQGWVERALELHISNSLESWDPTAERLTEPAASDLGRDEIIMLGRRATALMAFHLYNEAGHKIPRRRTYLNRAARGASELDDTQQEEAISPSGIARIREWDDERLLKRILDSITEGVLKHLSSNEVNLLKSYGANAAYELVHDGLGRPFVRWALRERNSFDFALASVHALRGDGFRWQPRRDVVLRKLTWNGCEFIGQHFVDVEFADCDLAGCFFVGCSFTRTRFTQRTILNGAVFRECHFLNDGKKSELDHVQANSVLFEKCELDGLEIHHTILEGATFRKCEMAATVLVENSHVLLAQFTGLAGDGVIKLRSCDVAYCRIEPFRTRGERARVVLEDEGETCALLPRTSRHWEDEPAWEHATL